MALAWLALVCEILGITNWTWSLLIELSWPYLLGKLSQPFLGSIQIYFNQGSWGPERGDDSPKTTGRQGVLLDAGSETT